uniref:Uncharacterized protein n=1 Tax=Haemonchus contortus TaxID=6289 RepID=W6NMH4_HAECO
MNSIMSQNKSRSRQAVNVKSVPVNCPSDTEVASMTMVEILNAMMERNEHLKDPIMAKHIDAMITKLPQTITEAVQAKKERSLVLFGIPESNPSKPPSVKQQEVENSVSEILDCLRVECRPVEVYRMGKPNDARPRLVKVMLPSRSHWITALTKSHCLRSAGFSNVYVRKSMTAAERKHEFELREECRARNKQLSKRIWVVYRGEIRRVDELPKTRGAGNA